MVQVILPTNKLDRDFVCKVLLKSIPAFDCHRGHIFFSLSLSNLISLAHPINAYFYFAKQIFPIQNFGRIHSKILSSISQIQSLNSTQRLSSLSIPKQSWLSDVRYGARVGRSGVRKKGDEPVINHAEHLPGNNGTKQ